MKGEKMANPLHNLEDGLQRLREDRDRTLREETILKDRLGRLESDISKFENAINLIKGE